MSWRYNNENPYKCIGGISVIRTGILNPEILSLLARVRHTNSLVIADRGFPYWPSIETVDISLVDDIPTVLQVFEAIKSNFVVGQIFMAEELPLENPPGIQQTFESSIGAIPLSYEPHEKLKLRVPDSIGLLRTGDTIQYANMVLVSA
jgi:D-ribose pyranase